MQGTLSEIDLRSILQLIELGQRTGQLFIETYRPTRRSQEMLTPGYPAQSIFPETATSWFVFFVNGQVVYAADQTYGQMKRLRDYLRRYSVTDEVPYFNNSAIATTNDPEYGYLWLLLEKNFLTPHQARQIIRCMVEETLFDLLNVRQGSFIFEMGNALDPPMIAFEVGSLITQMTKQIQEWKQFHPHIQSPDQVMVITNQEHLHATLSDKLYQRLVFWANGKTTLRQLARYLHRDLPTVARGLHPYVEKGLLQFQEVIPAIASPANLSWETSSPAQPPQIVCIDDDVSIGKQVELILNQQGYHCHLMFNPLDALSQIFQLQPDLILCDITMPQLDGYEICAMLRHSTAFRQTPLIMLTGKETFMDRIKAQIVGATDYLTKPFGASELLLLMEKYLGIP